MAPMILGCAGAGNGACDVLGVVIRAITVVPMTCPMYPVGLAQERAQRASDTWRLGCLTGRS